MAKLTREEKAISRSFENGEWKSVKNFKINKKRYQHYAQAALSKDQRINIRLSSQDLHGVQKRAVEEGIPYQTLIASVLHKYVSGSLIERRV